MFQERTTLKIESFPQKQPSQEFSKKIYLKNFTKFTGKHMCRRSLLKKRLRPYAPQYVFSVKFANTSGGCVFILTFFMDYSDHCPYHDHFQRETCFC